MAIADVVSELNRIKAIGLITDYAIGGAVAAQAYIAPMSTEDVDVFVVLPGEEATSLTPFRLIYPDLISHGAKVSGPYVEIGGWPIQFLAIHEPRSRSAALPFAVKLRMLDRLHERDGAFRGARARFRGQDRSSSMAPLQTGHTQPSRGSIHLIVFGADAVLLAAAGLTGPRRCFRNSIRVLLAMQFVPNCTAS